MAAAAGFLHLLPAGAPAQAASTTTISVDASAIWLAVALLVGAIGIGALIVIARYVYSSNNIDESFIRSWMAGLLVVGLLVFCAVLLTTPYDDLRNIVFGGLVASVASAVAYYFASKEADRARHDQISAVLGTTMVPDLAGISVKDARALLGGSNLRLIAPADADDDDLVAGQQPAAGEQAPSSSAITIQVQPAAQA